MNFQLTITFRSSATQDIAYLAELCKTSPETMPGAVELVLEDALNKKMHSRHSNIFSASALSLDTEGQYQLTTELDAVVAIELNDIFAVEERDYNFATSLGRFIQEALTEQHNFEGDSAIIVTHNNALEPH